MLCQSSVWKISLWTNVGEAGFEVQGSAQAVGISPSVLDECDDVLCQWQVAQPKG